MICVSLTRWGGGMKATMLTYQVKTLKILNSSKNSLANNISATLVEPGRPAERTAGPGGAPSCCGCW